jgi:hypothetical protein
LNYFKYLCLYEKINGVTKKKNFLIEHYVDYGAKWVSDKLSRSINTVRIKASYNGLSFNNIDGKYKEIFLVILSLHPIIIKNVLRRINQYW